MRSRDGKSEVLRAPCADTLSTRSVGFRLMKRRTDQTKVYVAAVTISPWQARTCPSMDLFLAWSDLDTAVTCTLLSFRVSRALFRLASALADARMQY